LVEEGSRFGFNRVLARLAAKHHNLRVVDWVAMVAHNRGWIGDDGVHPDVTGYMARPGDRAPGAALPGIAARVAPTGIEPGSSTLKGWRACRYTTGPLSHLRRDI
jgi:hypothetical protein